MTEVAAAIAWLLTCSAVTSLVLATIQALTRIHFPQKTYVRRSKGGVCHLAYDSPLGQPVILKGVQIPRQEGVHVLVRPSLTPPFHPEGLTISSIKMFRGSVWCTFMLSLFSYVAWCNVLP
jgi:hypothetical protein